MFIQVFTMISAGWQVSPNKLRQQESLAVSNRCLNLSVTRSPFQASYPGYAREIHSCQY